MRAHIALRNNDPDLQKCSRVTETEEDREAWWLDEAHMSKIELDQRFELEPDFEGDFLSASDSQGTAGGKAAVKGSSFVRMKDLQNRPPHSRGHTQCGAGQLTPVGVLSQKRSATTNCQSVSMSV